MHEHPHDHPHHHPHEHPHRETYADRPHPGSVLVDVGSGYGAVIIHTTPEHHGEEIHISPVGVAKREHVEVLERSIAGNPAFTAVFGSLPAGPYQLWKDLHSSTPLGEVTVLDGEVVTLDWR